MRQLPGTSIPFTASIEEDLHTAVGHVLDRADTLGTGDDTHAARLTAHARCFRLLRRLASLDAKSGDSVGVYRTVHLSTEIDRVTAIARDETRRTDVDVQIVRGALPGIAWIDADRAFEALLCVLEASITECEPDGRVSIGAHVEDGALVVSVSTRAASDRVPPSASIRLAQRLLALGGDRLVRTVRGRHVRASVHVALLPRDSRVPAAA